MAKRQTLKEWIGELFKFGFVGGIAYIVDTGLFNLLRFGPGELLLDKPLTAKVLSVAVATLVAWLGNRYWTFAGKRSETVGRELAMFVLVNVGGMLVAVLTLWFSHYVLRLTSPLADNISANVIGVGLGTIFRYVAYRYWVFPQALDSSAPDSSASHGSGLLPLTARGEEQDAASLGRIN